MTLREKRVRLTFLASQLVQFAAMLGYEMAFDYCRRCEGCKVGHPRSLHYKGLAIDINLYKDGEYLMSTEDHRIFGEWWEANGGTWGGRFNDGNHYSIEHEGMR